MHTVRPTLSLINVIVLGLLLVIEKETQRVGTQVPRA